MCGKWHIMGQYAGLHEICAVCANSCQYMHMLLAKLILQVLTCMRLRLTHVPAVA